MTEYETETDDDFDVSPEMIKAGVSVLCAYDGGFLKTDSEWAAEIFTAMREIQKQMQTSKSHQRHK